MKKIVALFLFILFLILAWLSWGWYKDTVVCCEEPPTAVQYGPLIFDCSTGEVITNHLWPQKKREIMDERIEGKKLLLVGPYFTGENKAAGIDRAEKVKALMSELPSDQFITDARSAGDCESTKMNMLHELRYKWVYDNDEVIQNLDKTMVFYKYDSDVEVTNENVLAYFDELSEFLKNTGDRILLTGHTDSDGTDDYNIDLALKRANEYKAHLVSLGVDESKIDVQSKGESEPIRPNDVEENKKMNRRVEVHIIE